MAETNRWWICTAPLWQGGEKILGPFESRELALEVRGYVEKVHAGPTYWVDDSDPPEHVAASSAGSVLASDESTLRSE